MNANGPRAATAADEVMLHRLARLLADADPPPRHLREAAGQLLTWRTVDAELAELFAAASDRAAARGD